MDAKRRLAFKVIPFEQLLPDDHPDRRRHLYVFQKPCKGCLLSDGALTDPMTARRLVANTVARESHFVCHVASIHKRDVMCKAFFDKHGDQLAKVRLGASIGAISEVEQPPYPQQEADALQRELEEDMSTMMPWQRRKKRRNP